jgi:PKD repeat protein
VITLTAHDTGGTWSGPGVTGNTFDPAVAGLGNHIIEYSIINSGCSDSDKITIIVVDKPDATITPVKTTCTNDSKVTLIAHDTGGIWSGPGVTGSIFDPATAGPGSHIIKYIIRNSTGCTDSAQTIITVVQSPDATITPVDTLCINGPAITLVANDTTGVWSGAVSNNNFDPAVLGAGDHIVNYTITDINGCTDMKQITISVVPVPIVNISHVGNFFINSPPVKLNATPPGGIFSGDGMTDSTFTPGAAGLGTHVIQYQTIPDRFGCNGVDTIHINVIMPSLPVANFEPDTTGCTPLIVQFVNKSFNGETYLWDFGDNVYSEEPAPEHVYYTPGSYVVTLTVTNVAGQSVSSAIITVYQNPTALFSVYPTEVTNTTQIVICSSFSYFADSQLWKFGDGTTSTDENPYHKYESEGAFKITLIVTSKEGCIDSASFPTPVHVSFNPGNIRFPNAFVWNRTGPNGGYWQDGNVDDRIFRPHFENILEYKLQIFNRWGVLIYESHDLHKGWDGYFGNANLALQGVYVWKATGRFIDGRYFDIVGDVTFLH